MLRASSAFARSFRKSSINTFCAALVPTTFSLTFQVMPAVVTIAVAKSVSGKITGGF
jgi:hypothetical protein